MTSNEQKRRQSGPASPKLAKPAQAGPSSPKLAKRAKAVLAAPKLAKASEGGGARSVVAGPPKAEVLSVVEVAHRIRSAWATLSSPAGSFAAASSATNGRARRMPRAVGS